MVNKCILFNGSNFSELAWLAGHQLIGYSKVERIIHVKTRKGLETLRKGARLCKSKEGWLYITGDDV